jgi:septum formation protein
MTKKPAKIILCSTSPRRKQMLQDLNIAFEVCRPEVPEHWNGNESPRAFAMRLAGLKVGECMSTANTLRIGMDTIVVVGRQILGKPANAEEAQQMLSQLSDRSHRVITAVALTHKGKKVIGSESTEVRFRALHRDEIRWYVQTGEPLDKAGAYAIQGFGRLFITSINGCYFNVVGFPIACFQRLLKKLGFTIVDLMSL